MPEVTIEEVKSQFEGALKPLREQLGALAEDLEKEKKRTGVESPETKAKVDEILTKMGQIHTRMESVEGEILKAKRPGGAGENRTTGQYFIQSDGFKSLQGQSATFSGRYNVTIPHAIWTKTAIVNDTPDMDQPLVAGQRVGGIVVPNLQRLTIRDLLSTVPTSSNVVAFTREASFTNNAASQGAGSSPFVRENVAKAESAMTFELIQQPVETIAHWIPASSQVLDDAAQLQGHIDTRLRYGLKLEEESQLLNGSGSGGELDGLVTQATAYNTALDVAGDTKIDTLRHAILQGELAFHNISVFVLNPSDWSDIELKKDNENRYIFAMPQSIASPRIWGRTVVSTTSISSGDFLALDNGPDVAQIFDRQQVNVAISREHSDYFVKNMVAILCEERLALCVYKPLGLITGSYPASA